MADILWILGGFSVGYFLVKGTIKLIEWFDTLEKND
jgi:hypothetical protein